ncbi:MAG: acyl-CoA dehydrogenase, partial [Zoogloea sp.]|nr:acyl-CoA dehydrogenase [Zoogloea sp.]
LVETTGEFSRRWMEAAFVPVVTPSLTQLHGELVRQAALRAA